MVFLDGFPERVSYLARLPSKNRRGKSPSRTSFPASRGSLERSRRETAIGLVGGPRDAPQATRRKGEFRDRCRRRDSTGTDLRGRNEENFGLEASQELKVACMSSSWRDEHEEMRLVPLGALFPNFLSWCRPLRRLHHRHQGRIARPPVSPHVTGRKGGRLGG